MLNIKHFSWQFIIMGVPFDLVNQNISLFFHWEVHLLHLKLVFAIFY